MISKKTKMEVTIAELYAQLNAANAAGKLAITKGKLTIFPEGGKRVLQGFAASVINPFIVERFTFSAENEAYEVAAAISKMSGFTTNKEKNAQAKAPAVTDKRLVEIEKLVFGAHPKTKEGKQFKAELLALLNPVSA